MIFNRKITLSIINDSKVTKKEFLSALAIYIGFQKRKQHHTKNL